MAFDTFGAPQFGLADAAVAAYNATNDYGTEVDIPSVQFMGVTLQQVSAQLEGDDQITDAHANAIGFEVRVRFGSISLDVLEVITTNAVASSGSSPNQVRQLDFTGGDNMPYFGLCGKSSATVGSGDTHMFVAKCKLMGDFQVYAGEYGRYTIPEVTLQAISDATYGLGALLEHQTAAAVAIPPTNIN